MNGLIVRPVMVVLWIEVSRFDKVDMSVSQMRLAASASLIGFEWSRGR